MFTLHSTNININQSITIHISHCCTGAPIGIASHAPVEAAQDIAWAAIQPYGVLWFIYLLAVFSATTKLAFTCRIPHLVVLAVGAGANNVDITEAGGWIVLLFAVIAWYHAAGDIIESTFGRKVLPFGPTPIQLITKRS